MRIEVVTSNSTLLQSVKSLWRANSSTLGFFPEGAFADHARRQWILAAIDEKDRLAAYLLFRTSQRKVSIVHLCVDEEFRGKGAARELVKQLSSETKEFLGIGLRCRRDFPANRLWPKLGFTAVSELSGRGLANSKLTYWWLDHGHPTLFAELSRQQLASKTAATIDANIFFELFESANPDNEESKALQADWLQDSIELCLTGETLNEINRGKDVSLRRQQREFARGFLEQSSEASTWEPIAACLEQFFKPEKSESDESDIRQIAKCIAGGCKFFVTKDGGLLDKSAHFYSKFGLVVIRPCDLILRLDEMKQDAHYQPRWLAGTRISFQRVRSESDKALMNLFVDLTAGERVSEFQRKVRNCLADAKHFSVQLACNSEDTPLAIVVYDRRDSQELNVPLFRVRPAPGAPTLANYLVFKCIVDSAGDGRTSTRFSDSALRPVVADALVGHRFFHTGSSWVRANLAGFHGRDRIVATLKECERNGGTEYSFCGEIASALNASSKVEELMEIERTVWPSKIAEDSVPNFLVPIRPQWAEHLFDARLAEQGLFGALQEVALRCENIYYRSAKNSRVIAPGRILWYVSQDRHYAGSGSVRACSILEEVIVGKPKELFGKYERFGIYQWKDVFKTASGNIENQVMCLRFSHTELFRKPVSLKELKRIKDQFQCRAPLVSPHKLPLAAFEQLYKLGTEIERVPIAK